jgi:hypothetical protein
MRLNEINGALSMHANHQKQDDSRSEPSPMAIIGAILAQGAMRRMDRQKREQLVAQKNSKVSASRLIAKPSSTLPTQ